MGARASRAAGILRNGQARTAKPVSDAQTVSTPPRMTSSSPGLVMGLLPLVINAAILPTAKPANAAPNSRSVGRSGTLGLVTRIANAAATKAVSAAQRRVNSI